MNSAALETEWLDASWFPVKIGFCPNEVAWKKTLKSAGVRVDKYPSFKRNEAFFISWRNIDHPFGLILISPHLEGKLECQIMGIISHECTHAFQFIMEVIKEPAPGDEIQAYGIQCLVTQTIHAWMESQK